MTNAIHFWVVRSTCIFQVGQWMIVHIEPTIRLSKKVVVPSGALIFELVSLAIREVMSDLTPN